MQGTIRLALVCALLSAGGCAGFPGKNSTSSSDLPSPTETVAASQPAKPSVFAGLNPFAAKPPSATPATSKSTGKSKGKAEPEAKPTKSLPAELAKGRSYERNGDLDRARKVYEVLRRQFPQEVAPAHRLGVVADKQRKHGEAEQLFLFALQKKPKDGEILSDLGYCYYLQGQFAEAEKYARQAVAIDTTSVRYRNNLGLALGQQKKYDEAFKQFRAAGSDADGWYNLAFVYASQDEGESAKECFERALVIDPMHEQARTALQSFEKFEQSPTRMQDNATVAEAPGTRWVPYQEALPPGAVEPASRQVSHETALPANRSAGLATRALQLKSRGLSQGNQASK